MLRVAVCDDDKAFVDKLHHALADILGRLNRPVGIELFSDPLRLAQQVEGRGAMHDVAILDLEMPRMHGFDVAHRLRKVDSSFKLIFLTSHSEKGYDAFRYSASAFIPKGEVETRLEGEILAAIAELDEDLQRDTRAFQAHPADVDGAPRAVAALRLRDAEIWYFESAAWAIIFHTSHGAYSVHGEAFESLKAEYRQRGFVETHRTVVVNPAFIKLVGQANVKLTTGEKVALSRRLRAEVLQTIARNVRASLHDDTDTV